MMIQNFLEKAISARQSYLETDHQGAFRLFAGFYEGCPDLVADLYARTLVLTSYIEEPQKSFQLLEQAQQLILGQLPWIPCVVQKQRFSTNPVLKRGRITFGNPSDDSIVESGVRYSLELTINQDASFYLDTRNLRSWLLDHAHGLEVLNTFAYTGSLGVAALAGGAAHVVQVDRNARFLELARRSVMLNRFDLGKMKLRAVDFFSETARYKKENVLFDLAIIDPPFFSVTEKGTVDMVSESIRLINKLRPLLKDGGWLIAINNALFLPGKTYIEGLEALCKDGYLEIEEILPIPADITGFADTIVSTAPSDPAPFNHPTKIVVMRVKRKAFHS